MSTHDEPYGLEAAAKQHIIGELTGRYVMDGEHARCSTWPPGWPRPWPTCFWARRGAGTARA